MDNTKCLRCGLGFYAKPSQKLRGKGKYCSAKCSNECQKRGRYIPCKICDAPTWRTPANEKKSSSGVFFCSKSCQAVWRNRNFSGPSHPLWAGGVSKYREILIESGRQVLCRMCGEIDIRVLVVHHRDRNRRNSDVENLTWVCFNCHRLIHKHGVSLQERIRTPFGTPQFGKPMHRSGASLGLKIRGRCLPSMTSSKKCRMWRPDRLRKSVFRTKMISR